MTYVNGTRCGRKLTIYIVGFFFVLELKKEIAFAISQAPFIIDTEPELILTIFDNQNMINPSLF